MKYLLVLLTTLASVATPPPLYARFGDNKPSFLNPMPSATELRLAWSRDGRRFEDSGVVFVQRADAPALLALPNGRLVAMFDYAGNQHGAPETTLSTSVSSDGGRSWSPVKPIRFKGKQSAALHARHGALVLTPQHYLRLFFVGVATARRSSETPHHQGAGSLYSAVSANGLDFRREASTRIRLTEFDEAYPNPVRLGDRLHLYISGTRINEAGGAVERMLSHYIETKGRRFAPLKRVAFGKTGIVGSVMKLPKGARAYVSTSRGVESYISVGRGSWKKEPGLCLSDGWDPAVARLRDGSYMMLYCRELLSPALASSQLVKASDSGGELSDADTWSDDVFALDITDDIDTEVWAELFDESVSETDVETTNGTIEGEGNATDVVFATGEVKSQREGKVDNDPREPGTDLADGATVEEVSTPMSWLENYDPIATNGFAPPPDFEHPIDYIEWYKRFAVRQTQDNAYDAYSAFMPGYDGLTPDGTEWPKLTNMFKDDAHDGPAAPWNPADHPAWESSNETFKPLIEKFHEAALHKDYASPPDLLGDATFDTMDGAKLLIGIMLPALSPHRDMVRATLADAWRTENGKVSSQRMLKAFETTLRSAAHLGQGATLIEELVSTAERALVQDSARWALKHDLFSEEELETALETFRKFDRNDREPRDSIRGEHGFSMDVTQYLFSPPDQDGRPKINMEHANNIIDWTDATDMSAEDFAGMTAEDADTTIQAFNQHYRELGDLMNIGYPEVRSSDIDALVDRNVNATPLIRAFLPALGRYYTLKTRLQASTRATQLAYATHLFKARNGRWPESLNELPAEHGEEMRTDPFSGEYFIYQLTDEGPRIYSVSEDGIDNGGVHSRRWEDSADDNGGSDDHVFWPPQAKRPRK